jgi:hypothetical protein
VGERLLDGEGFFGHGSEPCLDCSENLLD